LATPNLFSLLGVAPQLGRDFGAQEETVHPVAIVSDAFWRTRMGGSAGAIGSAVELGGTLFTVIGVMPPGFAGLSGEAELWTPIAAYNLMYPELARFDFPHSRDVHFMRGIGRLKAGVSLQAAAAEMKTIGERLARQYPNENRDRGIDLASAQADLSRNVKDALQTLFAAVALVLLIACANVANLVLVRLSRRRHELAVRTALGATPWHLLRYLWSETALFSIIGAGLGFALFLGVRQSWQAFLPLDLPKFTSAQLDARVLLFSFTAAILTAGALALLPLAQLRPGGLLPQLISTTRAGYRRSLTRARAILTMAQVALAVVLTAGAGLMIRSMWRLHNADLGFRPDHLVTMRFDVPPHKYTDEALFALPERVVQQVQSLPGVQSAAVTSADPLVWSGINRGFEIEGHEPYKNQFNVYFEDITPGYFRTLGIPLLEGRDFTAADDAHSQPVMIVSRAFARQYLPGQDPIGKRIRIGGPKAEWRMIVGLVGDAQVDDVHNDKSEVSFFFSPMRNAEVPGGGSLLVRTAGSPQDLPPALRRQLQGLDPDFTIYSVATMQVRIATNSAGTRSFTWLMAIFGSIALGLALLGTYGIIAYSVAQRTREFGIRIALGAQRSDILRLVTAQGMKIVAGGLLIGLALSLMVMRFLATMLFRVNTHDPVVLTIISVMVGLAAVCAMYVPARRAASTDAVGALRQE
jgi:putative ABC transport system permease protein